MRTHSSASVPAASAARTQRRMLRVDGSSPAAEAQSTLIRVGIQAGFWPARGADELPLVRFSNAS